MNISLIYIYCDVFFLIFDDLRLLHVYLRRRFFYFRLLLLISNRCYSIDKPHNPLINAGALLTVSFVLTLIRRDMALSDKFEFVKRIYEVKICMFANVENTDPPYILASIVLLSMMVVANRWALDQNVMQGRQTFSFHLA